MTLENYVRQNDAKGLLYSKVSRFLHKLKKKKTPKCYIVD